MYIYIYIYDGFNFSIYYKCIVFNCIELPYYIEYFVFQWFRIPVVLYVSLFRIIRPDILTKAIPTLYRI